MRFSCGGFADAAGATDGLLIDGGFAKGIAFGHFDGAGGVGSVKISADFLGVPLGDRRAADQHMTCMSGQLFTSRR